MVKGLSKKVDVLQKDSKAKEGSIATLLVMIKDMEEKNEELRAEIQALKATKK